MTTPQATGVNPSMVRWSGWGLAVLTALTSFVVYWRARKPWYVWLNFTINGCGLLFSVGVIAIIAYFMTH